MLQSHSFTWKDFETSWYKRWSKELLQNEKHRGEHALHANKFWQNAVMAQVLSERGVLRKDARGLGFGVGQERLPALFAKHGVHITATDQDFTTQKAGHWAEYELATGAQSLNKLGICKGDKFVNQVEYMSVDMTKVPKKLFNSYDFVWSNCALGHLGSIPAGLEFIEQSLQCLKPGGWAVHTTELNILSNDATVTSGGTVIFRAKDIYNLQKKLTEQGYKVRPFMLKLGNHPKDKRISLSPKFGNDYSKIHFMDHLATQIVLIINKPQDFDKAKSNKNLIKARQIAIRNAYLKNLVSIKSYSLTDPTIKQMQKSKKIPTRKIRVTPAQELIHVKIPKGSTKELHVTYKNNSKTALFGVYTQLHAKPIVLGTTKPEDRESKFIDKSWPGNTRLTTDVWVKTVQGIHSKTEIIKPKEHFSFHITLNANKLKKGVYTEYFGIVQELAGWVPSSAVRVRIEVI